MISAEYKSAYQQGYSDAMRDFRKKLETDVLDKIKVEIEEYSLLTRERVIGIIDKYRKEQE